MSDNTTLRVGLVVKSPFVENCVLEDVPWENCSFTGISFEIFLHLAQLLNYDNLQLFRSKKDLSGPIDGVWGGLVGSLQSGEVDISASLLEVSDNSRLLSAIDFSIPVTTSKVGLVISTPVRPRWDILSIFEPFLWSVWICVVVAALLLRVILYWFNAHRPGLSDPLKIVLMTKLFMFNFMLFRCYKSNLFTVFVAKDRISMPFETLEKFADLFSENKIQLAYYEGSNLPVDIDSSTLSPWIKVRQSLTRNPLVKFDSVESMVGNVSNTPNLAFRMAYMTYLSKSEQYCNLSFIEISNSFLAFGFTKNSNLTRPFSKLLYHHSVSADHWDEVILRKRIREKRCGATMKKQTKKFQRLQIQQMAGAFLFLLIGSLMGGGVVVVVEWFYANYACSDW